jgi:hypothetical protein
MLELQPICAQYEHETRLALNNEISVLALYLQAICTECGLKTKLASTKEFRALAIDLHLIRAEYGLEERPAPTELIAVCFLLCDSPASEFYKPTFWNTLSVPSS